MHDADPRGTFAVEDLTLSSKAVIAQVIVNTRYMDLRIRRVRIRQDAFFRLGDACPGASMRGAKNAFFAPYVETIALPRQARDKHRESTQKREALSQGARLTSRRLMLAQRSSPRVRIG